MSLCPDGVVDETKSRLFACWCDVSKRSLYLVCVCVCVLLCACATVRGFWENARAVYASPSAEHGACLTHACACRVPHVDLDVSGLPCVDNSRINIKRMYEQGGTGPLFAVWARRLRAYGIPMAILENDFKTEILNGLLGDAYNIYPLQVKTDDVGHSGVSRSRLYIILASKQCQQIMDPGQLYSSVAERNRGRFSTQPKDYIIADEFEAGGICDVPGVRGKTFRPNEPSLAYLLNQREQEAVAKLDDMYRERFREDPRQNWNLVYFLGDDPSWTASWSAVGHRIPTFRTNCGTGKFWLPAAQRWLTGHGHALTTEGAPESSDEEEQAYSLKFTDAGWELKDNEKGMTTLLPGRATGGADDWVLGQEKKDSRQHELLCF
ncbi:unnamed protein product [Symbiodinium sp. CCMP2592]|nr:unnamed protein product [Symbiodinium sp. CCMP2592]CAE7413336.1 unnamed protein product [Symbiodinium sp. CCMP2592]